MQRFVEHFLADGPGAFLGDEYARQTLVIFVGARFEQGRPYFPVFRSHVGQRRRTVDVQLVRISMVIEQLLNQF